MGPLVRCVVTSLLVTATGKYIRVRLGESHVYGLLDSGSTVSVIHPRVLGRLLKQDTFRSDDEDPLVEGPFEDRLVGRAVNGITEATQEPSWGSTLFGTSESLSEVYS